MPQVKSEREVAVTTEQISIGSPASEVFEGIVNRHKDRIHSLTRITYNLNAYDDEFQDSIHPLRVIDARSETLRDISKGIEIFSEHGVSGKTDTVLAISSIVVLKNGNRAHIPMADLRCKKSGENLAKVKEVLTEFPGFVLDSGGFYQYWGENLLSDYSWHKFISHCAEWAVYGKALFDAVYIAQSRARGFAALRIFDYPPAKPIEPYVVAKI